jgi:hypothetical protein
MGSEPVLFRGRSWTGPDVPWARIRRSRPVRAITPPGRGGERSSVGSRRTSPASTKKTYKCRPFQERLKGFEPSTFCMASRTCGSDSTRTCLQTGGFWAAAAHEASRHSPGNHGGLGSEWVVELAQGLGSAAAPRPDMLHPAHARRRGLACERYRRLGYRDEPLPLQSSSQRG